MYPPVRNTATKKAPETMTVPKAALGGFAVALCTVAVLYLIFGFEHYVFMMHSEFGALVALPLIMGGIGALVGGVLGLWLKNSDPFGTPR